VFTCGQRVLSSGHREEAEQGAAAVPEPEATPFAADTPCWWRAHAAGRHILRKHGYPPDKQERTTQTVLEQEALLSVEWATA